MKNVKFDKTYEGVKKLNVPTGDGGYATFCDTSDATATTEDIAKGKTAWVDGVLVDGTAEGGFGEPWDAVMRAMLGTKITLISDVPWENSSSNKNDDNVVTFPYTETNMMRYIMVFSDNGGIVNVESSGPVKGKITEATTSLAFSFTNPFASPYVPDDNNATFPSHNVFFVGNDTANRCIKVANRFFSDSTSTPARKRIHDAQDNGGRIRLYRVEV